MALDIVLTADEAVEATDGNRVEALISKFFDKLICDMAFKISVTYSIHSQFLIDEHG